MDHVLGTSHVDAPPDQLDGLCCPRCGCAWTRVVRTVRLASGQVRRRRQCQHCGLAFSTMEGLAPSAINGNGVNGHHR